MGWGLALAAMALFCTLGTWQLGRMESKQAMLKEAHAVIEQRAAVSLELGLYRDIGYDWARGSGTFADAPALLLDNQTREGRAGVRVYRVFVADQDKDEPTDEITPVLVDLGWLPLDDRRHMPDIPRPEGSQWLEGLLTPPPSGGLANAPPVMRANGTVLAVNLRSPELAQMLRQPRLSGRVLRLDPALPLGYARDLDILPNTMPPERHLGYAVQWYALALTVLITALILTFRKPKPRP